MGVTLNGAAKEKIVFRAGWGRTALVFSVLAATAFTLGCSGPAKKDSAGDKKPAQVHKLGKDNIAQDMDCPDGLYGYKDISNKECCVLDADKTPVTRLQDKDMEQLDKLCVLGHIGDEGLAVIAASEHLPNIIELHLRDNDIGPRGLTSLAESKSFNKLKQFHLEFNFISDEGAEIIATSKKFKKLKGLNLTQNGIGDEGAKAIAKSDNIKNLRWVVFQRNEISSAGALALVNSKKLEYLKILNLSNNNIKPNQENNIKSKAPKGLKVVF